MSRPARTCGLSAAARGPVSDPAGDETSGIGQDLCRGQLLKQLPGQSAPLVGAGCSAEACMGQLAR